MPGQGGASLTDEVRIAIDDGVMVLSFNRPAKKNALSHDMYRVLAEALEEAETDPAIRAVLFEGEGGCFTAGNDLTDFAAVAMGGEAPKEVGRFLKALAGAQKPLVASVVGLAVGIGVTLLLHCDLVYVADDAILSLPFIDLGLVPEAGSSRLLPARIGHARAFAMFALGEAISGREAERIGLANVAAPAAKVPALALAAAKALARRPLGALKATKALMRDGGAIAQVMEAEIAVFVQRLRTREAAEAFQAFAERRPPDFMKLEEKP